MLFWQPIMQRRRQEQRLVHIRGSKGLSHGRILTPYTLWKSCYVWCFCRIYSRQTPSGRLPFDAPNRVLFWADVMGPWKLTLIPVLDVHTGFPYSVENQYREYIGPRNVDRFP